MKQRLLRQLQDLIENSEYICLANFPLLHEWAIENLQDIEHPVIMDGEMLNDYIIANPALVAEIIKES